MFEVHIRDAMSHTKEKKINKIDPRRLVNVWERPLVG